MEYEQIILSREGRVATVTLNRPDKLNAYTDRMMEELRHALHDADTDGNIKVIILTGAGRGFCSGHDLSESREKRSSRPGGEQIDIRLKEYPPLVIRETDKPLIAAVNGIATGGGLAFALACDIRIASENASFMENHVSAVGSIPGFEIWYLPRLLGVEPALKMILTGQRVEAKEAERLGLVSEVVPPERLLPRARELADKIAEAPLLALRLTKKVFYQGLALDLETTLNHVATGRAICQQAGILFRPKQ